MHDLLNINNNLSYRIFGKLSISFNNNNKVVLPGLKSLESFNLAWI